MGEVIPFPIQISRTDYWQFYEPWAKDAYWVTCETCKRAECFRAGHWFVACKYHSGNDDPPPPYVYFEGPGGSP